MTVIIFFNKELSENVPMKHCRRGKIGERKIMTVFDVREIISFDFFYSFILNESIRFNTHKHGLFRKYDVLKPEAWDEDIEKYQEFRFEYRALVSSVVQRTIKQYRSFLPEKCFIAEYGCFVTHTERILSDVEFKICYDEPQAVEYECIQELICYSVTNILRSTNMHKGNLNADCFSRQCRLLFDGFKIDYQKENKKNVCDYEAMLNILESGYKNTTNKLSSFNILENTAEHDFFADLARIETRNYDRARFNFEKLPLSDNFSISELRRVFENDCIDGLCRFAASVNELLSVKKSYSINVEMLWSDSTILGLFGADFLNDLKRLFVLFIFYWNRMELSFHSRGILFDSSVRIRFTIDEIDEILFGDWGQSTNMQRIISVKKRLTELIIEGMTKLAEFKEANRIKFENREIELIKLTR